MAKKRKGSKKGKKIRVKSYTRSWPVMGSKVGR